MGGRYDLFPLENSPCHVLRARSFPNQGSAPSFDEMIHLWVDHHRKMKRHSSVSSGRNQDLELLLTSGP